MYKFADIIQLKTFQISLLRGLKQIGLTVSEYSVLYLINDKNGCKFSTIGNTLKYKDFQNAKQIQHLIKKGLIQADSNLTYHLTEQGKQVLFACNKIFDSIKV